MTETLRVVRPNGLELSCPAEAGISRVILAHNDGPGAPPYGPARRVSFSELLGCRRHLGDVAVQLRDTLNRSQPGVSRAFAAGGERAADRRLRGYASGWSEVTVTSLTDLRSSPLQSAPIRTSKNPSISSIRRESSEGFEAAAAIRSSAP
jgi:hypothetical protein